MTIKISRSFKQLLPLHSIEECQPNFSAKALWKGLIFMAIASAGFSPVFTEKVLAAIDVNNSFAPANIYPTQKSRLTINLTNSALSPTTSVAFSHNLPADVFIATPDNVSNTCGGTVTSNNTATSGTLTFSGGTIPAGDGTNAGKCTIAIDITSTRKGTYIDSILAGEITGITNGTPGSNTQSSNATLVVLLQDVTGTITYTPTALVLGETTSRSQIITLRNLNPVPLTGVSISNDMNPNAYNIRAIDGTQTTTCGSGVVTITPRPAINASYGPTSRINMTGGTIPANSTCTITVGIEPSRDPKLPGSGASVTNTIPVSTVTTNEGATNSTTITGTVTAYTGIAVNKYFDGVSSKLLNLDASDTSVMRVLFYNYNGQPHTNLTLTDNLPTVLGTPMTIVGAPITNTCGGTINYNSGTNTLNLTGGTIPAAISTTTSSIIPNSCEFTILAKVSAVGSYVNRIPQGTASTGNSNGYQYNATSATLSVYSGMLSVTKSLSPGSIYQGDPTTATITIQNVSNTATANTLNLTDDLNTLCAPSTPSTNCTGAVPEVYYRIAPTSAATTNCVGTLSAPIGGTTIKLQNASIPPNSTCTITVPILSSGHASSVGTTHNNTIPIGNITFTVNSNPSVNTYSLIPSAPLGINRSVQLVKSFSPTTVAPLGRTRLRIRVIKYSTSKVGATNLAFTDNLPTGHTIASNPNVLNQCGGTVTATPGASSVNLTGGSLSFPSSTSSVECSVYVNVVTPALSGGFLTQSSTNTIPGDIHSAAPPTTTPWVSGNISTPNSTILAADADFYRLENTLATSATITRQASAITVNKEFLTTNINGGATSRVRISFSNIRATAINLTEVGLTDAFPGTDLRLYANVNPKFTDSAGNVNSNGCRGGIFAGNPGATSITMTDAQIDAGSICYFEFNVTGYKGGNHVNTLAVGDLKSAEGVTNDTSAAATLTVGRQVNVGKGFTPDVIGLGETSTLTLYLYNTNTAPNNETGLSPALTDTLPAGMQVVGTPTTTCSGGTASAGISGSNAFIRLDGGTLVAEDVCTVTAKVTTSATGLFSNTVPIGNMKTLGGATNPDPANASLRVIAKPTITKSFSPTQIAQGALSTMTLTISNPNNAAALSTGFTGLKLSDTFTNMTLANPLVIGGTCTGLTYNGTPGGNLFEVTNANLLPSASCTVTVPVTSNVVGLHNNQTTGVTSNQNLTPGNPSNVAQLRVLQPATLSKSFSPNTVVEGDVSRLTFTLTNPNPVAVTIDAPGFTDILPNVPGQMLAATPLNLSNTCSGATVRDISNTSNLAAGESALQVRGGTLAANSSCTIGLDVLVPVDGTYENTTSTLLTTGGTGPAATASVVAQDVSTTNADVLLVKRITAVNGNRIKNPNDNTPLNQFVDDNTSPVQANDNNSKWPASYLLGAINGGKIKPGDEVEYTLYFLNAGTAPATNVRICDRLQNELSFKMNAYGTNQDIQLQLNSNTPLNLTSAADALDRAELIAPGAALPTGCTFPSPGNPSGVMVIDLTGASGSGLPSLTNLPKAVTSTSPNSLGFIRFTTKIKP